LKQKPGVAWGQQGPDDKAFVVGSDLDKQVVEERSDSFGEPIDQKVLIRCCLWVVGYFAVAVD